ncbi:MAG: ABC transporter ATP-binding protein [Chloroflexota bacterium]|nr:MAG: ABC transporter ATP-binding protein [Chloroflexota bacterium]
MLQGIKLTKRFGGLIAVDELDLQVAEGELVGLIGPNGAGKSTAVNLLTGKCAPTSGEVLLNGSRITRWPPHRRACAGIMRTFQMNSLFWQFTLLDNMRVAWYGQHQKGLAWHSILGRKLRDGERQFSIQATNTMDRLGIAHLKDRQVSSLTPGQQRIVGLGVALIANPQFLLLDEPLAGLSWQEANSVMKVVRELVSPSSGMGVLLIEHHVKSIVDFVDRLTAMSFGRKLAEGSARDVTSDETVIQSYLGRRL